MRSDESLLEETKPRECKKDVKRRNQVRGACLSLYKDFFEATDMGGIGGVNEPGWLGAIDCLCEFTV
jgi:hypothetical protein